MVSHAPLIDQRVFLLTFQGGGLDVPRVLSTSKLPSDSPFALPDHGGGESVLSRRIAW